MEIKKPDKLPLTCPAYPQLIFAEIKSRNLSKVTIVKIILATRSL